MDVARKTELVGLTEMERVALASLLARVVAADRTLGRDEQQNLAEIVDALGADAYDRASDTAGRLFEHEDELRVFLECIRRREAREVIYGAVLSVSLAGAVTKSEAAFLDWLAQLWGVEARPVPER